jgi:hypothetical protein
MKEKLWLPLITCLAYCIDKALYKAIDYLREQVRVLVEHQEKDNKRIQIVYLGYAISKSTVKNILIENGYDPEPDLTVRSTWHEFIKSHWDVLAACDFFTIELLVGRKLVRCTVFFVIELATRKVFYAPIKLQPDGVYMKQVAKLLVCIERLGGLLKSYHRLAA